MNATRLPAPQTVDVTAPATGVRVYTVTVREPHPTLPGHQRDTTMHVASSFERAAGFARSRRHLLPSGASYLIAVDVLDAVEHPAAVVVGEVTATGETDFRSLLAAIGQPA